MMNNLTQDYGFDHTYVEGAKAVIKAAREILAKLKEQEQ